MLKSVLEDLLHLLFEGCFCLSYDATLTVCSGVQGFGEYPLLCVFVRARACLSSP